MKNYIWAGEAGFDAKIFNSKKSNKVDIDKVLKEYKNSNIDGVIFNANNELWKDVLELSVSNDLEFHIWKPIMRSQDIDIEKKHKDWFALSKSGVSTLVKQPYVEYYKWFCPNNIEVKQYLLELVNSYILDESITSLHLDYIRYNDLYLPKGLVGKYGISYGEYFPEYDFCYCENCRKLFIDKHGVDPVEELTPDEAEKWTQFRFDSVSNIVQDLVDHCHNKGIKVSAAIFPGPSIAKESVFQNWGEWDLDLYFPMNYYNFYNKEVSWLNEIVKEEKQTVNKKGKLISGLFLSDMSPDELSEAITYSMESGADGVSLYSDEMFTGELLSVFKEITSKYR